MPGPWDKYAQAPASSGPWAKYGQQASQGVTQEPTITVTAPARLPGVLGDINDFGNDLGDAVVHHLGNIPLGVAQAFAHYEKNAVDSANAVAPGQERTLTSLITGDKGQPTTLVGKGKAAVDKVVGKLDQYIADREKNYQQATPDSVGSYAGATIGEVLPWLVGGGEARAAGLVPKAQTLLGKLGLSATEGAAMGATQPVTGGNYNQQKLLQTALAGVASPLAEGAIGGSKALVGLLKGGPSVNPLDRAATDILTREAENPAALSKAAPSLVPGVTRTLAEETLDPGVARLERNLRSTNKQFDAQDRSNNAARVGALEKIAGSDADMAAALNARDTSTNSLRDAAFNEGQSFDAAHAAQQSASQTSHAATAEAIDRANTLRRSLGYTKQLPIPDAPPSSSPKEALQARIGEVIAKNNGNPAVQTALSVVGGALRQAEDSVPGLYNVRKYVNDLLSGRAGGDTVSAKAASRELIDIKGEIDQELQRRAPTFSKYLTAFQDASKPINRMDVGRDLLQPSSGSAVLDPVTGSQVLTPAQFSKKARDLDTVAARATGFAKAKAENILSDSDIATIKAIQDDLERQSFRATAGSGGNSQTFERQALQDRMKSGVTRGALRQVPVVGRFTGDFLDMLDKSRNERVKERLAYLVANPAEARRVLASLPPAGQKIVNDALLGIGGPVGRLATTPGNSQPSQ